MSDDTLRTLRVGQRVLVKSAVFGAREAIIRSFRWDDDGDRIAVVDLEPPAGRAPTGASMGWPIPVRNIEPLIEPQKG
jgi:hypothetical protein